ncbi:sugar ABC transporter, ATP-binding protein [Aurantimonas manganoxydans SI85-9A1]|uniref:Sugar ABC transporter, ATP-binding protein n=1 Tax=Aurantimonas manganoxydans (strain ATCC BAA-1229 / DSM 21871 / SI85-9A1) TaxID=287752 RepID=Q1YN97_AURMS|nr:ABC transporter ATP-binding protein [Aurantimonas manganoxydans]EAS51134.1 sugar ABC transporter, ATP-binding protein [Aurantimonas manganoxydans SI85-9A1]
MTAVLSLEHITKRFGDFAANDDVSLTLHRGELVALLGENGAGKTTLMNILFGHYVPDAGRVLVAGEELPLGRPRAAIAAGVGMVHQHFTLAPNLTVLENVMTGTEPLLRWRSGKAAARRKLASLAERFGLVVDPDKRVGDLSVGEQQRVEILKALYNDAKILILDEPTAVLTRPEAETLFKTLRVMAAEGLSLIFISHKLHEVMAAADRVLVLRAGRMVAERATAATSKEELAELMVGRRVTRPVRAAAVPGDTVLAARTVTVTVGGTRRLSDVSFHLRERETLGIIGVSGNGQATLAHLVSGLVAPDAGGLSVLGEETSTLSPRDLVRRGVGRIPEDRNTEGAIGELAIWENAILERVRDVPFSKGGFVRQSTARAFAADVIDRFDIRGGSAHSRTRLLSGGNMQKLIFGRNLAGSPRVLVAAQPTRGLDEGAIAAVHGEILAARDAGAGVLLISEDLDEVLALADRVQAIVGGRLSEPVPIGSLDARRLGLMMAGEWAVAPHEAA